MIRVKHLRICASGCYETSTRGYFEAGDVVIALLQRRGVCEIASCPAKHARSVKASAATHEISARPCELFDHSLALQSNRLLQAVAAVKDEQLPAQDRQLDVRSSMEGGQGGIAQAVATVLDAMRDILA